MSTSGKVVCGKNCAAEYPSKKRIQSMGRSESGRTQHSLLSAAGHRVGASIGRTRGQPRLHFSVALTECAPWVLNCQCACFVFVRSVRCSAPRAIELALQSAGPEDNPGCIFQLL